MVQLDAAQRENLSTALVVARAWAVASGNDPNAVCERVAFCAWTESRGYIYANDGRNTSNSPGFTASTAAILRRSLNLPHDLTGSNGRSTGMYQQTSEDVGGGWGDMAGTMDPAISTARLLARLVISNPPNPVYAGTLLTPTGTRRVAVTLSHAIAADVLRVQQPLADEAESSNYNATQVAIAREIVAQLSPSPATGASDNVIDWINMADQAALAAFAEQIQDAGPGRQFQLYRGPAAGGGKVLAVAGGRAYHVPNGGVISLGQSDSVKLFSKDILEVDQNVMNWLDEITDDRRMVKSRIDKRADGTGVEYDRDEFFAGMDEKDYHNGELLAKIAAKLGVA